MNQKDLKFTQQYLEAIFDANPNIMVVNDGREIDKVNKQMLGFTGFSDLSAFKKEHSCICDLFLIGHEDCIAPMMGDENWVEFIDKRPRQIHTVCMLKNELPFYFTVTVERLDIDTKDRYLIVFNDITQQYQFENELKESKALFDYFMDNTPFIVVIKDENLRLKYSNKLGKKYTNNIAIGKKSEQYFGKEMALKVDALARKAQKEGVVEDVIKYEKANSIFRVFAFTIPMANEQTDIGMIYIDITKEKQMADELKEKEELMIAQSRNAAMGEMISMIAHQWRQPISVIAMDANNVLVDLELETLNHDSLKSDVTDIIEQTQHLSQTIDDFRNFFKPNKFKDEVNVSDVFKETLSVIEKSFQNSNISIENDFQTTTKIEIFSRELLQVFLNILKNAKEALVESQVKEKKISNKIYEDEKNIIIEISDNGDKITDDVMHQIFNPYFSTKDEKNGTGLGLYMSKVIIEKHLYGTIEVENRVNNVCFTIKLPKNII